MSTAPIFFNVKEAREYLLQNGHVYTIRKKRSTGITMARQGNIFKFRKLGPVEIRHIGYASPVAGLAPDLNISDERLHNFFATLEPYVAESGFRNAREWWEKVNGVPWTDYHIYYVELITGIEKED